MRWFGVPKGRLAAPCLFGGLRPFEAARLSWEQVNLGNQEIRLRGQQAKTGKGRTVEICPTLKAWLSRYKGIDDIHRPAFDLELRDLRASIGYGEPTKENPGLKPWVPDILRHTAISRRAASHPPKAGPRPDKTPGRGRAGCCR